MNKMTIQKILSHVLIILAMMFLVFFCIDRVNPAMEFIDNDISNWLLCIYAVLTVVQSILCLTSVRRGERAERREKT